jgi:transposase
MTAARVVIEVGTHSAWVQDVISEWGHEVLVANPRLMEASKRRKRKSDRIDANKLARLGRVDPQSLHPIRHRSREVRQDLVVLRARDALVSVRTELINTTRGLVKSMGTRLPRCSSPSFAQKVKDAIPVEVEEALLPLVQLTKTVNDCIARYDQKIEELGQKKYGHTTLLRQVKGVGPITSLAYVLTLEDPQRFSSSREVGPYLGLVPNQEDSGDSQPQLPNVTAVAGGELAVHVGSLRTGHRLTAVRTAIVRARRKECEEASRGGGGTKAGRVAASPMGDRGCL